MVEAVENPLYGRMNQDGDLIFATERAHFHDLQTTDRRHGTVMRAVTAAMAAATARRSGGSSRAAGSTAGHRKHPQPPPAAASVLTRFGACVGLVPTAARACGGAYRQLWMVLQGTAVR